MIYLINEIVSFWFASSRFCPISWLSVSINKANLKKLFDIPYKYSSKPSFVNFGALYLIRRRRQSFAPMRSCTWTVPELARAECTSAVTNSSADTVWPRQRKYLTEAKRNKNTCNKQSCRSHLRHNGGLPVRARFRQTFQWWDISVSKLRSQLHAGMAGQPGGEKLKYLMELFTSKYRMIYSRTPTMPL